jgi:hypothetical protein
VQLREEKHTMPRVSHIMSRRAFLKISVHPTTLIINFTLNRFTDATSNNQTSSPSTAYGTGLYGQGRYPGYQTYFPLVKWEGN